MCWWGNSTPFSWYIIITIVCSIKIICWINSKLGSTMFKWSKFSYAISKTSSSWSINQSDNVVCVRRNFFYQSIFHKNFLFSERTSRANFKDHINTFSSVCRGIDYSGTSSKNHSWQNKWIEVLEENKIQTLTICLNIFISFFFHCHLFNVFIQRWISRLSFFFQQVDNTVSHVYSSFLFSVFVVKVKIYFLFFVCVSEETHIENFST